MGKGKDNWTQGLVIGIISLPLPVDVKALLSTHDKSLTIGIMAAGLVLMALLLLLLEKKRKSNSE